jgi:hypothetical protein
MVIEGDETTKATCRTEVAGKNTTNLKAHLRVCHAEVYLEFEKSETELKASNTRKLFENTQPQGTMTKVPKRLKYVAN